MFNKKAENKINVFKLQYYSLKSKPRPLGVLLVLVFCIFHTLSTVSKLTELSQWCDPIRPFFIYWRQNSGRENPETNSNWRECMARNSAFGVHHFQTDQSCFSNYCSVCENGCKVLLQHVHYCGEQRQKTQYHPNIGGPDCESLCNFEENDF